MDGPTGFALPDSICPVPWLNLSIDTNGSVRPCCKFEQPRDSAVRKFTPLNEASLAEVWNSAAMVKLREDFLAGAKPVECRACWSEEASGVPSLRQEFVQHRLRDSRVDYSTTRPPAPRVLDLKLSNLCNLKCRICSPTASSTYLKEELEHRSEPSRTWLANRQDYYRQPKLTGNEESLATFKSWLPFLEHVELFGGEPMIGKEVREIEDLIVAAGVAGNVSLLYNTNITVFREEMAEKWRMFRRVSINLSLDDIGARLEYQRSPSKWETIRTNIHRYNEIRGGQIGVSILCTVSSYNVWYLPEFVETVLELFPGLVMRFNFVHDDPEFCVKNLPVPVKAAIAEKLVSRERSWEAQPLPGRERFFGSLGEVVSFMQCATPDPGHWRRFIERTAQFDLLRAQSFQEIFPEYHALLEPFLEPSHEPTVNADVAQTAQL
jgi:MoaA/NifB/PqqE/SkfB family radical SAM enzyme